MVATWGIVLPGPSGIQSQSSKRRTMLRCGFTTPFGSPVLPEVNKIVHGSSGPAGTGLGRRLLGARVIATAGTERKREYLRGLGIADVFDSRDLSWAESVRAATRGRGADVILNSLTGAAIALGLDVLAEDGRFIEIGKKDIYLGRAVSLDSFRKGISVSAVDMAGLMDRRPERFTGILEKVWSLVVTGKLKALPVREYAFTDAAEALREMSHGNQIGKFVVSDPQALDRVTALPMPGGRFRADSAYLISGGLGALGLSLAEFLAENGAGALVLVGRSAPGRAAAARVEALRKGRMRVETIQCDVSDRAALHQAVTDVLAGLPPLRGVIHAAGVLADATIADMSPAELTAVLAPKVDGARHLADVCAAEPLNFFVLFSSAAALVGNAGQAAYAARPHGQHVKHAGRGACQHRGRLARGLPHPVVPQSHHPDYGPGRVNLRPARLGEFRDARATAA